MVNEICTDIDVTCSKMKLETSPGKVDQNSWKRKKQRVSSAPETTGRKSRLRAFLELDVFAVM